MTRIDFYVLPDVEDGARQRFAARWAQRALADGKRIHLRAPGQRVDALDALLWDYPPDRFLPHAPLARAQGEPVTIGAPDEEPRHGELLVNLCDDIAAFFPRFERVAEVVLRSGRGPARDKYRSYRDRGYPLFHHDLDDWE